MTRVEPRRGQRADFPRELNEEDSGNGAFLHKHCDFNYTTDHVCTTTASLSPFFIKRFAVRGWEKVFGCMYVFVSPPLGLPGPLWADLIDSGLGGRWGCLSPSLKLFNGRVHFRLSPTVLIPYSSSVKVLRAQKCIYFYLITTNMICHCVKNRFSSIKMGQDANLLFPSWECK